MKENATARLSQPHMPKRQEVIQLATELFYQEAFKNGYADPTTPEDSELLESGFYATAKSMLMADRAKAVNQEWKGYNEIMENLEGFKFDTTEAMQTTSFVSGSRGSGKSDVCMMMADRLMNEGITVIAFDPSTDWIQRSGIPEYMTVKPYDDLPIPENSIIYDVSLLVPLTQQKMVENFAKKLFEYQVFNGSTKRFFLVLEESQLFFPLNSLRSKNTQNCMRILTVGRNIGISLCSISQFPASVDKELIKNAQQIYIGCTSEPNTLAYWKGILDTKTSQLKDLLNGQFLYYRRNKISKIEIQPYENSTVKKQIVIDTTPKTEIQPLPTPQKTCNYALAKAVVIGGVGLIILLLGGH